MDMMGKVVFGRRVVFGAGASPDGFVFAAVLTNSSSLYEGAMTA
jgi:hypothetical protein